MFRRTPRYRRFLPPPSRRGGARLGSRRWGWLVVAVALVGAWYLAFGRRESAPRAPVLIERIRPRLPVPARHEPPPPPGSWKEHEGAVLSGVIERGRSLLAAAQALGVPASALYPAVASLDRVFDLRKARPGQQWRIVVDADGQLRRLEFVAGPLQRAVAVASPDGATWTARLDREEPEVRVVAGACRIGESLYASLKRCGEGAGLAAAIAEVFSWDVDFFQDVRSGDEVRYVVEKRYVRGEFHGYGRLLAARYEGRVGTFEAYYYADAELHVDGWYAPDGSSLERNFLRTPLKYTRISSGYTHHRYHPILHRYKAHLGIDYAAPEGTPVWAIAKGVVTKVGHTKAGGNIVTIRHSDGYTSHYAHLSRFARGLHTGMHVAQKQVIGYVGHTGRVTGPHLHFALRRHGRHVNPLKVKFTQGPPLPQRAWPAFEEKVRELREALERAKLVDGRRA